MPHRLILGLFISPLFLVDPRMIDSLQTPDDTMVVGIEQPPLLSYERCGVLEFRGASRFLRHQG